MTIADPASLVEETKRQMAIITGLSADTVSRFDRAECGWMLDIDMLEHRSVPRTQDLLSSFEVSLDEAGHVLSWRRTSRFVRGKG